MEQMYQEIRRKLGAYSPVRSKCARQTLVAAHGMIYRASDPGTSKSSGALWRGRQSENKLAKSPGVGVKATPLRISYVLKPIYFIPITPESENGTKPKYKLITYSYQGFVRSERSYNPIYATHSYPLNKMIALETSFRPNLTYVHPDWRSVA